MKTRLSFGIALLLVTCVASEAYAQESEKCWEVGQSGTSVVGTIGIEFHSMGTAPDV
jgi:hypothetical protein